jgi:hypothetical protein
MNTSYIFGVVAGITQLYGYWLYNKEIDKGTIKPNATSWGLWSFGNVIATWSYLELIDDLAKGILPLLCACASVATFLRALLKDKFERPDRESLLIAVVDLEVIGFWLLTESKTITNLFVQIDAIISFAPLIRDVWKNPDHERAGPWFVWCLAYTFQFTAVILSYEKWWDLMYPINYFFLCLVVGLIAKFRTAHA